jgi:hypothetical protein
MKKKKENEKEKMLEKEIELLESLSNKNEYDYIRLEEKKDE